MIELKPNIYDKFYCPECGSHSIDINGTVFQGIHILADCQCQKCELEFYQDFPVGHALYSPISIGKKNKKFYDPYNIKWFSQPLFDSYLSQNKKAIKIEKKNFKKFNKVVILNCVDHLYGHVLLKLFNAQYYLDGLKDIGLIVILPKNFEWLLPDGIAEAWILDIKLSEAQNWFIEFDKFEKQELNRFEKVYLSLAFSHPDPTKIDISRFTKVSRFDMRKFLDKEINITFISREDRLWFGNRIEKFFYRVFGKLGLLKYLNSLFVSLQNRRFVKTAQKIRKELPQPRFNIVGMGRKYNNFPDFINNFVENRIDKKIEENWCRVCAKSHIVIGIHGSNMLIPTALSAGFIEIVPDDRLGNIVQDIFSPYQERDLLFLGRFCTEFATPDEISKHAISIIKHYGGFYLNMGEEYLKHSIYKDVSKWKKFRNKFGRVIVVDSLIF